MDEEQAFKRSRNTDEMVELRVLLQSKVKGYSVHTVGDFSCWATLLFFFLSPIDQKTFFFSKETPLVLHRMLVLLLEKVERT